jgi:hypothetical protein
MAVAEMFALEFGAAGEVGCPLIPAPEPWGIFLYRSGSLSRSLSQLILELNREKPAPLALTSGTETNIVNRRWL